MRLFPDGSGPAARPGAPLALHAPAGLAARLAARATASLLVALLSLPIRLYRGLISPLLPPACRFEPSCSRYALEALQLHGPVRGSWLAFRRLTRCHPYGGAGLDPVPPRHVAARAERTVPAK